MRVALIFPGISGIGFNNYGKGMEESWISHGLCSISAYAKNAGYNVELIDLRCLKNWDHFSDVIRSNRPDVVGITMMSVDYNPATKCIDIIKEVNIDTKIVVGGPHPSIMTDEVAANENIDFIITKEGEISFTELLRDLERDVQINRIIEGKMPILDSLPFADRELFKGLEYPLPVKGFGPPFVTIIAGRGCVYNCSYCQPAERSIFGKNVRRRSVDNVIEELKSFRDKYKFKSMMIHDDCITEDKEWVIEFSKKYRENGFTQPFACQSRADFICRYESKVQTMAEAGLSLMFIGFESGNQRVLNFIRKGTKVEHNYKAAEICRKYGIKIWANYMIGIPTETKEEIMDTVKMIRTIKPDHYSPAFYTPHPGSDLYDYCIKNNLSLIENHDSYRRNATEAKIKGIDYDFLFWALNESMGIKIPFLSGRRIGQLEAKLVPFFKRHPLLKSWVRSAVGHFQRR